MIPNWIIERKIDAAGRRLGDPLEYMKAILRASKPAFFRFAKIFAIAEYRGKLPADAYHVARIVAALDEDCGTCVQIEVNVAIEARVDREIIRHVLDQKPDLLPENLQQLYKFVRGVVASSQDEVLHRPQIAKLYGEDGIAELALAIGASRFLPIVKRTMGHATSCSKVVISV